MYSKQVLGRINSFKKHNLTYYVGLRYLHKYTTCLPSCFNHLYVNHQENMIRQSNTKYIGYKKMNFLPSFGKQNVGIFQRLPKQLVNHQPSRSHGNLASELSITIPIDQYRGFFKFLIDSPPVIYCQESLITLHSTTGLPWWATIILVTLSARTFVTLPFALYQQYIFAKMILIKYEMDEIVRELKAEANTAVRFMKWEEKYTRDVYNRSVKKEWDKLIIRDNCHPMKGFVVILLQIPMWIFLSGGLRNLSCLLPYPTPVGMQAFQQLSVEGFGWLSNLTATDPYWILPILFGVTNLINIEFLCAMRQHELTKTQKFGFHISRVISIALIPIAGIVPSCLTLYWTTSSAYGILQNLIIYSPRIRRLVRIPNTEVELDHPYRYVYGKLKEKFSWKK